MRLMRSVVALGGVVVVGAGILTACSSESEPAPVSTESIPQAYIDYVDEVLDRQFLSDFQREALEDYVVTDAELQEAKDRFLACVEDEGYEGAFSIRALSYSATLSEEDHQKLVETYQNDPDAGLDKELSIVTPCEMTTVFGVAHYYAKMKNNPKNLSEGELARTCLDKIGLADDAAAVPDEDLIETIDSQELGSEAYEHCSRGPYVE